MAVWCNSHYSWPYFTLEEATSGLPTHNGPRVNLHMGQSVCRLENYKMQMFTAASCTVPSGWWGFSWSLEKLKQHSHSFAIAPRVGAWLVFEVSPSGFEPEMTPDVDTS